jgi:hypothetical protein
MLIFQVDSKASHHMVHNYDLLTNYENYIHMKPVNTVLETKECSSLGEGELKIEIRFDTKSIILCLKSVQYVPGITSHVFSCHAFENQFKNSYDININSGYIYSRKINEKLNFSLKSQLLQDEESKHGIQVTCRYYLHTYYYHSSPAVLTGSLDKKLVRNKNVINKK